MSYAIEGIAYDNRQESLTALVAKYVSAGGENGIDEIKSALRDSDTPDDIVGDWGEAGEVQMGRGEEPASAEEIAQHIQCYKADIAMEAA